MMSILGATHDDMEVILKELGYKSESRLEAEIKPVDESAKSETKSEEASKPEDVSEASETTVAAVEPAAALAQDATGEEEALEEEKRILIWRFGGGNRNSNKSANAPRNKKNFSKKNQGKPGGNNKPRSGAKQPKPKQIDPDSPFAALAALKSSMKSGE